MYDWSWQAERARRTHGSGAVVLKHGSFHLRYWADSIIDGQPKKTQKSVKLCDKDAVHFSTSYDAVKKVAAAKLAELAEQQQVGADVTVASFWETTYLSFVEQTSSPLPSPGTSKFGASKHTWHRHSR